VKNFGGIGTLMGKESPIEQAQYQQQLEKLNAAEEARRQKLMAQARAKGPDHPVPLQFLGEITKQIDQDSKDRNDGLISLREFDRRMKKHAIEIQTAYNADPAGLKRAKDQLAAARRQSAMGGTDYAAMFGGASAKELEADFAGNTALAGTIRGSQDPRVMEKLRQNYDYLRSRLQFSNDPADIQKLVEARANLFKTIEDGANQLLQFRLSDAHTPGARTQAYQQASRQIGQGLMRGPTDQLKKDLAERDRLRNAVDADRKNLNALGPLARFTGIRQKLRSDTQALARLERSVKKDGDEMADALLEKKIQQNKIRDDAYSSRQQGRQVELAYRQSTTTDKSTQDAMAIQSARAAVADAARTYGRGSDEWKQAMTTAEQRASHRHTGHPLGDVDSENALITARASGDPASAASARRSRWRSARWTPRVAPTRTDKNAINQARASLITAHSSRWPNFLRDQATRDLAGALQSARGAHR
jgi:hypothetical protein